MSPVLPATPPSLPPWPRLLLVRLPTSPPPPRPRLPLPPAPLERIPPRFPTPAQPLPAQVSPTSSRLRLRLTEVEQLPIKLPAPWPLSLLPARPLQLLLPLLSHL